MKDYFYTNRWKNSCGYKSIRDLFSFKSTWACEENHLSHIENYIIIITQYQSISVTQGTSRRGLPSRLPKMSVQIRDNKAFGEM